MNGVPCTHYTYTADNVLTEYGTVSGSGGIYIALDGGHVVHYTFNGHGLPDRPSDGGAGDGDGGGWRGSDPDRG